MGQIKNIKLHIVTDIKELLLSELQLTMEDASNKAQIIEKVSNHVEEVERENAKSGECFACKLCGKEFWIQSILKDHYTGCHKRLTCMETLQGNEQTRTDSKPYQCTFCNKHFRRISSLKSHQEHVHFTKLTSYIVKINKWSVENSLTDKEPRAQEQGKDFAASSKKNISNNNNNSNNNNSGSNNSKNNSSKSNSNNHNSNNHNSSN